MTCLVALLLLIVQSTQNASQSVSQSHKSGNPREDAQHKEKVPPPATPKPAESKVYKPTFYYNQTDASETSKPLHNWVDILNAISTAVVGAFTIVLALIGVRQLLAARAAERAWVVVLPPGPPIRNPDGNSEIRWELGNKGRTAAWVTSLGSAGKSVQADEKLPEEPPYTMAGPFPSQGAVLAPNGRILRGLTIPFEHMNRVEQGQRILYVFGRVEYRDVFRVKHETRYCYRFKTGPTTTDPSPRDFYVDGPNEYNKAT